MLETWLLPYTESFFKY